MEAHGQGLSVDLFVGRVCLDCDWPIGEGKAVLAAGEASEVIGNVGIFGVDAAQGIDPEYVASVEQLYFGGIGAFGVEEFILPVEEVFGQDDHYVACDIKSWNNTDDKRGLFPYNSAPRVAYSRSQRRSSQWGCLLQHNLLRVVQLALPPTAHLLQQNRHRQGVAGGRVELQDVG